ncbi:P-loop NTPase family protein, partial [Staphylococcus saprophyticus]|uniref:ABC transporter ATP-binding protein n=1 Tax=Staphylococcus saprophyticus TaxID=29385 RepID=UPI001C92EE2E
LKFNQTQLIPIIPPSPSPKTTFLTIPRPLQTPTSPHILINPNQLSHISHKPLPNTRMHHIPFILQPTNFLPFLTLKHHFKLFPKQNKHLLTQTQYNHFISQLNLQPIQNKLPTQISRPQNHPLPIPKPLYTQPSIILPHQPTASLHTQNPIQVIQILKPQTSQKNKTSILLTHHQPLTSYSHNLYHIQHPVLTHT